MFESSKRHFLRLSILYLFTKKVALVIDIDAKIQYSIENLYTKNKQFYNVPKPSTKQNTPLFPAALFNRDSDSETGEFIIREDLDESASW